MTIGALIAAVLPALEARYGPDVAVVATALLVAGWVRGARA